MVNGPSGERVMWPGQQSKHPRRYKGMKWVIFFIIYKTNQYLCLRKVLKTHVGNPSYPGVGAIKVTKGIKIIKIIKEAKVTKVVMFVRGILEESQKCKSSEHKNILTCLNLKSFLQSKAAMPDGVCKLCLDTTHERPEFCLHYSAKPANKY